MGLANPSALWLLLLVIPLILAWRHRPRSARAVGNAFLWQQVAAQSATSFVARLRRSRLLLAQVAFLLATVAALARPVLPFGPRSAAMVLDLSVSMGAREGSATRLEAAIARAISIVDSLPRSTRVRVIAARSVPEEIGEYVAWDPALRRAIRAQAVTAGPADISSAIDAARRGARMASDEVYVVSDGPPDASVRWVGIGTPASNAAITNVAARRLPLSPADGQVLVEAWNYSTEPLNAEIEVAQRGSPVGRQTVSLPPRQPTTLVFDVPAADGVVSARLDVNDVLAADNQRLAMFRSIRPVRVLVTGATFFMEKALEVNRSLVVDRVRGQVGYDVHVCEGCLELPPGDGAVLLIPAVTQPRADADPMILTALNHPIADALDLSAIRAVPVGGIAPGEDASIIARIAGRPAIVASESNGRRILELRLDVTDASLAVSSAFPILIANAIDWLARRGENQRELVAGEPLHWAFAERPRQPAVIGPAGRQVPSFSAGSRLTSSSTHAAGVYVVRGGATDETFVVNPATAGEADLRAYDIPMQSSIPATLAIPPTSGVEQQVAASLLLLALGLLSVEWWLRCGGARRA